MLTADFNQFEQQDSFSDGVMFSKLVILNERRNFITPLVIFVLWLGEQNQE